MSKKCKRSVNSCKIHENVIYLVFERKRQIFRLPAGQAGFARF